MEAYIDFNKTAEEQAVLKFTEEVTHISNRGECDETYERALEIRGKQKLAQAIFAIVTINSWNRIAIVTHFEMSRKMRGVK